MQNTHSAIMATKDANAGGQQGDDAAPFCDDWKEEVQDRIEDFIDSLQLDGLEGAGALEEALAARLYDLEISARSLEVRLADRYVLCHHQNAPCLLDL